MRFTHVGYTNVSYTNVGYTNVSYTNVGLLSVCDAGPTVNQHWINVQCLLGNDRNDESLI